MKRHGTSERGSTSIQVLVILVPVFFGFIGFAVDLGRLYLARGEIKSAANAMALAAAAKLIGTEQSTANANTAATRAISSSGGFGNRYDFGGITIGVGSGNLASPTPEPAYFSSVSDATGSGSDSSGGDAARYVRVDINAQAPLTFWGMLTLGQSRQVTVASRAVAGVSAPLCTACGIEAIAVAPLIADDGDNFGFIVDQKYTFAYSCSGGNPPALLAGTGDRVNYLLLNRYNEEASTFAAEATQAMRIGAVGLPGSTNAARSCVSVTTPESMWTSAAPAACNSQVSQTVRAFTCGLALRFDSALATACEGISEEGDTVASLTEQDSDPAYLDQYSAYTGNTRRVITVAVVESLSPTDAMTIIGFRQFLLQPATAESGASTAIPANDQNARFVATYIGSAVPLRAGSFSGCSLPAGPGKVVLYQ